jgi:hypothetical protein
MTAQDSDSAQPKVHVLKQTCFDELMLIMSVKEAAIVVWSYFGLHRDLADLSRDEIVRGLILAAVEVPADLRLRTFNLALNMLYTADWNDYVDTAANDGDPMGMAMVDALRARDLVQAALADPRPPRGVMA